MNLLPPLNPKAVEPYEKWLVCVTLPEGIHRIVEGAMTEDRALRAAKILQDHDDKNNHTATYWVKER